MTVIDLKNKLPEELEAISADSFAMVQDGEQIMDEKFQTKPIGFFKDAMIRLSKNKVALLSFAMIMLIIIGAYLVPAISGYTYTEYVLEAKDLPPKIPGLEKLGICDGTRLLEKRRVDGLTDTERYPEGSIIEIVKTYTVKGIEMCDVKVDTYKMAGLEDDVITGWAPTPWVVTP
jgi:oligopeptide transport system permease protein